MPSRFHDARDGAHERRPLRFFLSELPAPTCGEPVVSGATVVVRGRPLSLHAPIYLEPSQRWVQRPFFDSQDIARYLLDPIGDAPAMHLAVRQRFQNEHIERPGDQHGRRSFCVSHRFLIGDIDSRRFVKRFW